MNGSVAAEGIPICLRVDCCQSSLHGGVFLSCGVADRDLLQAAPFGVSGHILPLQVLAAVKGIKANSGILPHGGNVGGTVRCPTTGAEYRAAACIHDLVGALPCVGGPQQHGQLTCGVRVRYLVQGVAVCGSVAAHGTFAVILVAVPAAVVVAGKHSPKFIPVPGRVSVRQGQGAAQHVISVCGAAGGVVHGAPDGGQVLPVAAGLAVLPAGQAGLLVRCGGRNKKCLGGLVSNFVLHRLCGKAAQIQRGGLVIAPKPLGYIGADCAVLGNLAAVRAVNPGRKHACLCVGVINTR